MLDVQFTVIKAAFFKCQVLPIIVEISKAVPIFMTLYSGGVWWKMWDQQQYKKRTSLFPNFIAVFTEELNCFNEPLGDEIVHQGHTRGSQGSEMTSQSAF